MNHEPIMTVPDSNILITYLLKQATHTLFGLIFDICSSVFDFAELEIKIYYFKVALCRLDEGNAAAYWISEKLLI